MGSHLDQVSKENGQPAPDTDQTELTSPDPEQLNQTPRLSYSGDRPALLEQPNPLEELSFGSEIPRDELLLRQLTEGPGRAPLPVHIENPYRTEGSPILEDYQAIRLGDPNSFLSGADFDDPSNEFATSVIYDIFTSLGLSGDDFGSSAEFSGEDLVRHYQATRGLEEDGIVGRDVILRLDSELRPWLAPGAPPMGPERYVSDEEVTALNEERAQIARLAEVREDMVDTPAFQSFLEGLDSTIRDIAIEEGVDPDVLVGLVYRESSGNQGARSDAGAIGLTQLLPGTAAEMGVDPYNATDNLRGGARYLHQMLERYEGYEDSYRYALSAYNTGPGNVDTAISIHGGIASYTEGYVQDILDIAAVLRGQAE